MAQDENTKPLLEAMQDIIARVDSLPPDQRLFAVELAWLMQAQSDRNEALSFPGGFSKQQARQLLALRRIAELVEGDEPDLELERLWREGDVEGAANYVLAKMKELDRE